MATAAELARRWEVRQSLVEREFRASANGLGKSAVKFAKQLMTEQIYAIPEAVYASGKKAGQKKWKRTRKLRQGEKYELRGPFTVAIFNEMPYARRRHNLTYPVQDENAVDRTSHWRTELVEVFQPITMDVWHETVLDILRVRQG